MPDHVHFVIARHPMDFEVIAGQLKNEATRSLKKANLHPFIHLESNGETPSCWGERPWKTFLDCEEMILGRIHYVEENPVKSRTTKTVLALRHSLSETLSRLAHLVSPADEPEASRPGELKPAADSPSAHPPAKNETIAISWRSTAAPASAGSTAR